MTSHLTPSADGASSPSLERFGPRHLASPLGGKNWILYLLNLITAKTRLADLMAGASYLKAAVTMAGNRLMDAFDHVTVPIITLRAQLSQGAQGTRHAQCESAERTISEFTSTLTALYAATKDDLSTLTTQVMKAHETTVATLQADLREKQDLIDSYKVDLDAASAARRRLAAEKAQLVLDNADLVTKHDELTNEGMRYITTDQELQRVKTAMSTLQDQHRDLLADTQRQAETYRAVIEAKDAVVANLQDQLANYKAALATKNDVLVNKQQQITDCQAAVAAKDAALATKDKEIDRLMSLITLQTKDSSTASRGSSSRHKSHKSHKSHNATATPVHSCAERDFLLAFLESIPDTESVSYLKVYAKHNEDTWAQLRHIDGQQLVGFYAHMNGRLAGQLLSFKASCDAKKCVPSLTSSDTSTPPSENVARGAG